MKTFSFYDAATGLFVGRTFSCDIAEVKEFEAALAAHTAPGHAAVEGLHDHESRRVDLTQESPTVVDYQPPSPSPDHEWHDATKRWVLNETASARIATRSAALARIAQLESAQNRPIRELTRDPSNGEARKRLDAIDAEISKLREVLT
jgi:hypothetical protein